MIRFTVLLIVTLFALSLAACGGGGTPAQDGSPAPPSSGGGGLEEAPASDFEYTYDEESGGMVITKYTGSSIRVRVPQEIDGQPVTSIVGAFASDAFTGSNITEIHLPDSLTCIGKGAFAFCYKLTDIAIPKGVAIIGDSAFLGCIKLTDITIPKGVTSIGDSAFLSCMGLTGVIIPDGVTSIGDLAFSNCEKLTSVTIPDSVTSIGDFAFALCPKLTDAVIPDSVTHIGEHVFSNEFDDINDYLESQSPAVQDNSALTNAESNARSLAGSINTYITLYRTYPGAADPFDWTSVDEFYAMYTAAPGTDGKGPEYTPVDETFGVFPPFYPTLADDTNARLNVEITKIDKDMYPIAKPLDRDAIKANGTY